MNITLRVVLAVCAGVLAFLVIVGVIDEEVAKWLAAAVLVLAVAEVVP